MPFGLCNAPSTFQANINFIFYPHLHQFILVLSDDLLIYNPNWPVHLEHATRAFEILRQHFFFVKANKCTFRQSKLKYIGHIVTDKGVKVDSSKITIMINWPRPSTISNLHSFLGLTGYYRKFMHNYGLLAKPQTNLLKKGQFRWSEKAEVTFLQLKQAMTNTPILAMPNFNESFTIKIDASVEGIGAVLTK